MASSNLIVHTPGLGSVPLTIDDQGAGQPFLLLHGGGGPDTVASIAARFANSKPVRVLTPVHPGFAGTPRPDALHTIRGLAQLYVALLEQLDLLDVTVIGNSIGGWITAEMALLQSPRMSGAILVDAVGIQVPERPVADFFSLTMGEVRSLSFHNPQAFPVDPNSTSAEARQIAASNRCALELYGGRSMTDPTLLGRLAHADVATLVLWGDSDRIVSPEYGRAYAAAFPLARFYVLENTGHLPQIETPDQFIDAIWNCDTLPFTRLSSN